MVSKPSRYVVSAELRAQGPDASPDHCASSGVDVVLKGWKTGLNKVRLTKTLRAGGIGLSDASKLTGQILDGATVRVHLSQFRTVAIAQAELTKIGIVEVHG